MNDRAYTIETIKKFLSTCDNETYVFKTPIVASTPHFGEDSFYTNMTIIETTDINLQNGELYASLTTDDNKGEWNKGEWNLSTVLARVVKEPKEKGKYIKNKMEPFVDLILRVLEKENPEYFEALKFKFFEHKDENSERNEIVNQIVNFLENFEIDFPIENRNIKLLNFDISDKYVSYGSIEIYDKRWGSTRKYSINKFSPTKSHLYNIHGQDINYDTAKDILDLLKGKYPEFFEGDKFGFFEHKLNEDQYTNMMEKERWERDKIVKEIVKFFKNYENGENLSFDPPLENEYIILYGYDKHSEDFQRALGSEGKITVYSKEFPKKLIQYTIVIFTTTYRLYNKNGTNIDYKSAKNILELLKERYPEYFEGDKFGFFEHLKTFKEFESVEDRNNLDMVRENLEGFFNYFKDENNKVVFVPPIYIEDDFTLNGEIQIWRKYIRYFLLFHDTLRIYWSNDIDSSSCDGFFCIGFTWFNALIKLEKELLKRDEYRWYFEGLKFNLTEKITLDIEEGDVLLGGKFKNKQVKVKEIGKDDKNQPTINGKPLLKFRIFKQLPQKYKKRIHLK